MLELAEVSRYRDGDPQNRVLSGVDLAVAAGEVVVLTGASGAGKSTLLRVAAGLEPVDQGEVRLLGHNLNRLRASSRRRLRHRLGYASQEPRLLLDRTLLENVALALLVQGLGGRVARTRAVAALAALGLGGVMDEVPGHLSAGQRYLAGLARALVVEPALLLIDEPTGFLDPVRTADIVHVLLDAADVGAAVVVATTDYRLTEAAEHRELRTVELVNGHLECHGDTARFTQPIVLASNVVPFPVPVAATAGGHSE